MHANSNNEPIDTAFGSMFGYSQLECFVAVADTLHFGHAAKKLGMTQPPLSRQIQLLEREIGVKLLERSSRSVRLTPSGRIFLPEARRILRLSESAMHWTRRVWRGEAGTLRIGFTAAAGYHMLPQLVTRLRDRVPDVDIVLREMVSSAQIEALESGVLDVGFVRPPIFARGFEIRHIHSEPFYAALPRQHDLLPCDFVRLKDLGGQNMIMYSPDSSKYFFEIVTNAFTKADVSPRIAFQVSQIHSMLVLVNAGLGFALVPESATQLCLDRTLYRPLEIDAIPKAELNMVWQKDNDNPALQLFLQDVSQ